MDVYFAHKPLPMHKQAEPAHRAAVAAQAAGQVLGDARPALRTSRRAHRGDFVRFASELGLDVEKFKTDWANPDTAKRVQTDMAACSQPTA